MERRAHGQGNAEESEPPAAAENLWEIHSDAGDPWAGGRLAGL
jgi:hypothetical protein